MPVIKQHFVPQFILRNFADSNGFLTIIDKQSAPARIITTKPSAVLFENDIPADLFPFIAKYNNDPYMNIVAARVVVSTHSVTNMFSVIENRLLDALLLLEKEFGVLDDLDIDTTVKSPEEIDTIAKKVYLIVYNDQSIHIGDGNKIKDSTITTGIE